MEECLLSELMGVTRFSNFPISLILVRFRHFMLFSTRASLFQTTGPAQTLRVHRKVRVLQLILKQIRDSSLFETTLRNLEYIGSVRLELSVALSRKQDD